MSSRATRFSLVFAALAMVAALAAAPAPSVAKTGQPAPSFTLTDLAGKNVSSSSMRGKVVVLDFWATWCGPCVRGLPVVSQTAESYRRQGVEFYAINTAESRDAVKKFVGSRGWSFPVLLDRNRTVSGSFGVGGIPHLVVIDRRGVVHATHAGFAGTDPMRSWLSGAIESALRR